MLRGLSAAGGVYFYNGRPQSKYYMCCAGLTGHHLCPQRCTAFPRDNGGPAALCCGDIQVSRHQAWHLHTQTVVGIFRYPAIKPGISSHKLLATFHSAVCLGRSTRGEQFWPADQTQLGHILPSEHIDSQTEIRGLARLQSCDECKESSVLLRYHSCLSL